MDKLGVYLSCLSIRCLCIANINHLLRSSRTSGMWNVFDPCKSLKQELQYLCQARLRNFLIFCICLFLIQLLSPLISSALRMGCWRPYQIPKRHTTFSLCHLVSPAFDSLGRWGSRADIKLNLALEHTWIIAKVNMYDVYHTGPWHLCMNSCSKLLENRPNICHPFKWKNWFRNMAKRAQCWWAHVSLV